MPTAPWRKCNPVVYSHRGYWKRPEEQNSFLAIYEADQNNYGAEIDARSHEGELLLSHDPLSASKYCTINELVDLHLPLAINLKEDGILELINKSGILDNNQHSFVFDGSIPQMLIAKKKGMRHALRISEYEKTVAWQADYIWLDSFETDWWIEDPKTIELFGSYKVIVVSPEIHSRDPINMWSTLRQIMKVNEINFGICTDLPQTFQEFIHE